MHVQLGVLVLSSTTPSLGRSQTILLCQHMHVHMHMTWQNRARRHLTLVPSVPQTDYDTLVGIDADSLLVRSLDELFDKPELTAAANPDYCLPLPQVVNPVPPLWLHACEHLRHAVPPPAVDEVFTPPRVQGGYHAPFCTALLVVKPNTATFAALMSHARTRHTGWPEAEQVHRCLVHSHPPTPFTRTHAPHWLAGG